MYYCCIYIIIIEPFTQLCWFPLSIYLSISNKRTIFFCVVAFFPRNRYRAYTAYLWVCSGAIVPGSIPELSWAKIFSHSIEYFWSGCRGHKICEILMPLLSCTGDSAQRSCGVTGFFFLFLRNSCIRRKKKNKIHIYVCYILRTLLLDSSFRGYAKR